MASVEITKQCDICSTLQEKKEASVWCFECNESHCFDCNGIHRVMDISKDHKPIPIEDYRKLNPRITAIKFECEHHGRKFDFYCVDHDTAICMECVTHNHKNCSGLKLLSEVTENVKGSYIFTNLHERASDVKTIVQQIINDLLSSPTKVKNETDRVISIIEATRKSVNNHLDDLQNKLLGQIKAKENYQKDAIINTLTHLHAQLNDSQEVLNSLDQARRHASNSHTYCGIKQWNAEIEKHEDKLLSVQENLQYFDKFDVEINQKLTNILTDIKEFASIEAKYTRPAVKLLKKETHGQQSLATPDVNTDITLSNARVFTIPSGKEALYVSGCCVMESESMVFTDYNNQRLVQLDKDGKLIKNINLTFHPYDVVDVGDNTVAVTSVDDKKLVLVDICQGRVVRTVNEGDGCFGLCYMDGKFYVSVGDKIRVIDLDGKVLFTIDTEGNPTYCGFENNNIRLAAQNTDTVYCCDLTGNVNWKYTFNKGDQPMGITVARKETVLVACYIRNKIISIDQDGKESKVILTEKDGMNKPRAISYNKKYNALLVANLNDGKCFTYNMS